MKKKYQDQLVQVRRNHILDAAIAVIAEQGFQRSSIKQIAAQAEVSDGTIYNYFKNKDEILLAIIARLSEGEVNDMLVADSAGTDFAQFAQQYVADRMAEVDQMYPILKVVLVETLAQPALCQQVFEQIYTSAITAGEHYFQQMIERSESPQPSGVDAAMAIRLFAAPLLGLLLQRMLGDAHIAEHWQRYIAATSQMMLKMMDGV